MRKIAVSLSKGGVGKTTTAVNLSAGLTKKGYGVLLIDTDTQGQSSNNLGVNPEYGLAELMEGNVDPDHAIKEVRENLFLLAGGRELGEVKRLIARKDLRPEMTLSETLHPYEEKFDFVIVDTAPGWDSLTVNVLFYATEILCPVSLEVLAVMGFADFIKSLEPIQRYNQRVSINYVVPTFLDGRVRKSDEILQQLREYYPKEICLPIHYSVRLSESPGFGQTIFEYSPRSVGALDYRALTERVIDGT